MNPARFNLRGDQFQEAGRDRLDFGDLGHGDRSILSPLCQLEQRPQRVLTLLGNTHGNFPAWVLPRIVAWSAITTIGTDTIRPLSDL